jgi:hypothetical protein
MTAVVFVDSSHLLDHPQSSIQYVAAQWSIHLKPANSVNVEIRRLHQLRPRERQPTGL